VLPVEKRMFDQPVDTRPKGLILPRSLAADSHAHTRQE